MLNKINLESLSREEYINLILIIIYSFKFNYDYFTEIEKDFIKNAIDKNLYKRNEKI